MFNIDFHYFYSFHHTDRKYISPHCHDCYELCYYYSGSGTSQVRNQNSVPYEAKYYAIYAPNQEHDELHFGPVSVVCIGFAMKPGPNSPDIPTGIFCDMDFTIYRYVEQIKEEYLNRESQYRFMIELLISAMLVQCERQQNSTKANYDEIGHLKRIIDESFSSDLVVKEMVKLTGYSYHHFRHSFKNRFGISPKQYIMEKRLTYAKEMLQHSNTSISEIAQMSGFSTSSQFSSTFKKITGKSPTKYRNEMTQFHNSQSPEKE